MCSRNFFFLSTGGTVVVTARQESHTRECFHLQLWSLSLSLALSALRHLEQLVAFSDETRILVLDRNPCTRCSGARVIRVKGPSALPFVEVAKDETLRSITVYRYRRSPRRASRIIPTNSSEHRGLNHFNPRAHALTPPDDSIRPDQLTSRDPTLSRSVGRRY